MKGLIRVLVFLILGMILFLLYTMITMGYFRTIEGDFDAATVAKVAIKGPEDIVVSRSDHFLIISSDDRKAHRDGKNTASCGLYHYDLSSGETTKLGIPDLSDFHPHGIDLMKMDSGTYRLLVVNHVGEGEHIQHTIEEFMIGQGQIKHSGTYKNELIKAPNDVVIVDADRFYFTNDHGSSTRWGRMGEDYLGMRRSGIVYYDGKAYRDVAGHIAYANGIAIDGSRSLLYLASPRDFLIKVYGIEESGDLTFVEDIDCNTGVDNIALDEERVLWVGCHPDLLSFTIYAGGSREVAPSEVIKVQYRGKGDYEVTTIAMDDGQNMSAATVAIPYKNKLYLGNVMDDHMIVLDMEKL